jgi:asparagine synthase (glutamine-hydrolysing)
VVVDFAGAPIEPAILEKMVAPVAYRGVDGIHYWSQGHAALAHLALNTTPESLHEEQPLAGPDGCLCLVADGRLDNRGELLALLATSGRLPAKECLADADLILAAYQHWGERCAEHLVGDFAFAIWDATKQQLFCGRDPFGIKPLHYGRFGSLFLVASEAQQILQHPAVPCRLNETAVADYLAANFNFEEETMFAGIKALPSASYLVAANAGERIARYWEGLPEKTIRYKEPGEYALHFLELFQRAVGDRLRTNCPSVGVELSGGMDSTSIAAVAQKLIGATPGLPQLACCSYTFDELKSCDEREYVGTLVDELALDVHYLPMEQFWFLDDSGLFDPPLETPYMTWESAENAVLDYFWRRGAQVFLTGHSAERVVLGSSLVYADRFWQGDLGVLGELRRLKPPTHRLVLSLLIKPVLPRRLLTILRKIAGHPDGPVVRPWIAPALVRRTDLAARLQQLPIRSRFHSRAQRDVYGRMMVWSPFSRIFFWYDRLASQRGMEARYPFLDRRLADYVLAIPPEQLFQGGIHKMLLRRAMAGILPEYIRTRLDKTLFREYTAFAFQKADAKIRALFSAPLCGRLGFVIEERLRQRYREYAAGDEEIQPLELWPAITLELWLRRHHHLLTL